LDKLDWCKFSADEIDLNHLLYRFRPSEAFLNLCTIEGRAQLSIDNITSEAISVKVPYGNSQALLVLIKRIEEAIDDPEKTLRISRSRNDKAPPRNITEVFAETSREIISGSNLDDTLIAILEGVNKLVPTDFNEVSLIENENQIDSYKLQEFPGGKHRLIFNELDPNLVYSNQVFSSKTRLLITDTEQETNTLSEKQRFELPIRSYLGIPLFFSGDLIGAIELGSLSANTFNQNDLELLDLLSSHISTAIKKAQAFEQEKRRLDELDGIANIFNSINNLQDPDELFEHLVNSISMLLDVEIFGFFLYDEEQRILRGQTPFQGIPNDFVTQYLLKVPKNSAVDDLIQNNERILTTNAVEDALIIILRLEDLAIASGMHQTLLFPITRNQHFLGYLLIANPQEQPPFSPENQRFIESIAVQVAPIVENIALFRRSHIRIQRAEALRQIADLTGSQVSLDEILRKSVAELTKLIHANMAAVYLLDQNERKLCLHDSSSIGVPLQIRKQFDNLMVSDPDFRLTVSGSLKPFISGDINREKRVLPLYEPLLLNLNVASVINVPLIIGDQGIGEILLGSVIPDQFDQIDLDTLKTAANQLAGTIEKSRLASQTDEGLRNQVRQLTAVTQISRELSSTLDLRYLIQRVYSEALRTTGAECGTLLLFNPDETPTLHPQVACYFGENPSESYSDQEALVLQSREPLIFTPINHQNISSSSFHSWDGDREEQIPQEVKSIMIVPITYQDQVIGLLELHSRKNNYFDDTSKDVAYSLANQAAIAIRNAQQYDELIHQNSLLNRRIDLFAKLIETNQSLRPDLPLERSLETIASGIQESTPFNIVLISIYEPETQNLIRTINFGLSQEIMAELKANPQPWRGIQNLMQDEFRLGNAFFIPYERMPVMPVDLHSVVPISLDFIRTESDDWHPEDILFIPLQKTDGHPLGLISLDDPSNGKRPDRVTLESLEIYASQAALIIEVFQKVNTLKEQNLILQNNLRLMEDQTRDSIGDLTVLEHERSEQNKAIEKLELAYSRLKIALEITDLVSQQNDRHAILDVVGNALHTHIGSDLILVAENTPEGLQIIHRQGPLPEYTTIELLLGQLNPFNHCFSTNEILFIPDVSQSPKWSQSHFIKTLGIQSFLALPVQVDGKPESVFLAAGYSINLDVTSEDEELFLRISHQITGALKKQNLVIESQRRLQEINLLLEFNRQIESLDPNHLLRALVDSTKKVVHSAQAGFIALWQADRNVLIPKTTVGFTNPESVLRIRIPVENSLPGRVYLQQQSLRVEGINFACDYPLTSESLLNYEEATGGKLPISSLLIPILVSKYLPNSQEISPYEGVLVLDNYTTQGGFSKEDQALATSLTQQAALTLANYSLFQDAEQRADQLTALTGVSTEITSSLQKKSLISSLLEQLRAVVPFDSGTLWIRDQQALVVQATLGFEDSDNRLGLIVNVDDSALFKEMLDNGRPIYIGDTRLDSRFAGLEEKNHLTWLGVPISFQGNVIGVIALEKLEPNYYKDQDLELLMTFASQAATAFENARLYEDSIRQNQELEKNSRRANLLSRLSFNLNSTLENVEILSLSSQHLIEAISCSGISIVSFEQAPKAGGIGELGTPSGLSTVVFDEYPRKSLELPFHLPELPLFSHLAQTLGVFSAEDSSQEEALLSIRSYLEKLEARSLFILPMVIGQQLHSLWIVYSSGPRHFIQDEIDLARVVVNQAAISVEKARLFTEIHGLTQDLEMRVQERTIELAQEHQRTQTLLRLSTELSASLDIDYIIERTLSILRETTDATHISCLVWRPGEDNLRHAASIGYSGIAPMKGKPLALRKDQGLIGWIISNRKAAIIQDLLEDSRWIQLPDTKLLHRSAIAVPLMVGEELLGAIFLFHPDVCHFSEDKIDLVQAAANQVAVAINNAELYNLIREQAEELSGLLHQQKIETSQSRAILEAVAEGILVTDSNGYVMLFNDSAEKILQLNRDHVLGNSIDDFMGLFGSVGKMWIETIQQWARESASFNPGVYYSEQLNLDTGQVVSVNLAPVLFQNEFLGTVSIFHDITHQIEVDRLKTEFVATVSHELRTPMTSIKGYVEILLMGAAGTMNPQQMRFLEIVKNNTERLGVLVNDLLDLSRIEAGKVKLALQPMDIQSLIEGAIADFRQRSKEEMKPMQFSINIPTDLPRVIGDPERVRQIIQNLLENAYDYTPDNGHIKLRAYQSNGDIQVDIIDNGIGIPLSEQTRIFERFYRGEDPLVLASSGTGLGLNIVQQLVDMHHGRIWLTSNGEPGKGSTFSFTLPAYRQQVEQRSEAVLWQRS
jgi:PAS domain S-box-containing protein